MSSVIMSAYLLLLLRDRLSNGEYDAKTASIPRKEQRILCCIPRSPTFLEAFTYSRIVSSRRRKNHTKGERYNNFIPYMERFGRIMNVMLKSHFMWWLHIYAVHKSEHLICMCISDIISISRIHLCKMYERERERERERCIIFT